MQFGFGLKHDPPGYCGDFGYPSSSPYIPESDHSLLPFARYDLNQGPTSSCVWFYHAQALWILTGVHGLSRMLLSPMFGYYLTRKRSAQGGPIADVGCRPMDAVEVLKEVGWSPESAWPFDQWKIDDEPPWDALHKATERNWFMDGRIVETGPDRSRVIKDGIANHSTPIGVGLAVDESFMSWTADKPPWRRAGPIIGYHMVTGAAYDANCLIVVGSYGSGMHDRNTVRVAWDEVESNETGPILIPCINQSLIPV